MKKENQKILKDNIYNTYLKEVIKWLTKIIIRSLKKIITFFEEF